MVDVGVKTLPGEGDLISERKVHDILKRRGKLGFALDANNYFVGKAKDDSSLNVSLEQPLLVSLKGKSGKLFDFLVPDVWSRETAKHFRNYVKEQFGSLKKIVLPGQKMGDPELNSACQHVAKRLNDLDPAQVADNLWKKFLAESKAICVDTPNDCLSLVIDKYFSGLSPFGSIEAKKHEFPDAFALMSLEKYAEDNGYDGIIVSTKDRGPLDFCLKSTRLIGFNRLEKALGSFDSADEIERRRDLSDRLSVFLAQNVKIVGAALLEFVNQPYYHGINVWPAACKSRSDLQCPRVLISDIFDISLCNLDNFYAPVDVFSINESVDDGRVWVSARVGVALKARISVEVSGVDLRPAERNVGRVPIELDGVREFFLLMNISFCSLGLDDLNLNHLNIYEIVVEPVYFDVPDYVMPVGFA